jgi:hypothetical protein
MTFSELRSLIWYWTDDQNGISTGIGGYFTNTQVDRFLNNALKEVQKQLLESGELYWEKTVETMLVVQQQDYILPLDFMTIDRIEIVLSGTTLITEDKVKLDGITLNQQDLVFQSYGTPRAYTLKQDRISVYPIPDTALKLRLYYEYLVAEMSADADVPDVPERYHEYIAVIAALDCFVKDDRAPSTLLQKYDRYQMLLKQASANRKHDGPRMVRLTNDDDFGSLY